VVWRWQGGGWGWGVGIASAGGWKEWKQRLIEREQGRGGVRQVFFAGGGFLRGLEAKVAGDSFGGVTCKAGGSEVGGWLVGGGAAAGPPVR
jgi:hypothetical protein